MPTSSGFSVIRIAILFSLLAPGIHAQSLTPQLAQTLLDQAVERYQQHDFQGATAPLNQLVTAGVEQPQIYAMLATAYLRTERVPIADLTVDQGLQHFSNNVVLRFLKAETLAAQDAYAEAITLARSIETQLVQQPHPDLPLTDVQSRIGALYQAQAGRAYQAGHMEEAIRSFEDARLYLPDSLALHNNIAYLYLEQEQWENAKQATEQGLARFPDNVNLLQLQAQALFKLEAYEPLEAVYARLYASGTEPVPMGIAYGQVLMANGKAEQAQTIYTDLLDRFPKDTRLYDALTAINERQFNQQGVLTILRLQQKQFPEDPTILNRIAQTLDAMEDWDAARAAYDSLSAYPAFHVQGKIAIAQTFEQQDSLDAAVAIYETLLDTETKNTTLWRVLGHVREQQTAWHEAQDAYESLLALQDDPFVHRKLGWVLEQLDQSEAALAAYEEALTQGTTHPLPYYRKSVLLHADQSDAAYALGTQALKLSLQRVEAAQEHMRGTVQTQSNGLTPEHGEHAAEAKARLDASDQLAESIFYYLRDAFPFAPNERLFRDMLADYPGSGKLFYLVGTFYANHNNAAEAQILYEQAVRFTPRLRDAHVALGTLYESNQAPHKAIQSFERALTLDAEGADAYQALIRLYRAADQLERLTDRWLARYRSMPDNIVLREHLIEAFHKAGRHDDARALIAESRPSH